LRKRSIIISSLCILLALPSGALAEGNKARTPQTIKVERGKQQNALKAVKSENITALADDTLGPVLVSATAGPATVGVNDTITITAIASDDVSGVAEVLAYLNLPSGGYKVVPLTLENPETGEWKGTYTITEFDQEGTWIIDFDLYDAAGNDSYGEPIEPIQVNNPNGDSEVPTLVEKSVTPLAVAPNEEVKIRAVVNDNVGVSTVFAKIYTADSFGYYYMPLTLAEGTTNEYVGSHYFSESDPSGNWFIDIDMTDIAGNFDWLVLDEVVELTNPSSDNTDPIIGDPVITPAVASAGQSVRLRVPVSDQQSGVSSVYAEFFHIDSPTETYLEHLTQDPTTGEWYVEFTIQSGFPSGVWNVDIYATDSAGNTVLKEVRGAFDVDNNSGDFDAPEISKVVVTPVGDVQIGQTVTITADVTDNAGLDMVYAEVLDQAGFGDYVPMSYDVTSNKWIGSYVVQDTTAPGFYSVRVSAYDTSLRYNSLDAQGGITVINPIGDFTGPVISDIALDKTEVNAGEQITISASVEDESGVALVSANYDDNKTVDLKYDSTLNKWVGTITVPTNTPDGELININFVNAADTKGNVEVSSWYPVSFTVHNADGDYTAPEVESVEITPAVAGVGEKVQFKAKVTDAQTGVKSVTVALDMSEVALTFDGASGLWVGSYTVKANDKPGDYTVYVSTEDNNGNSADTVAEQTLTIDNPNADVTGPVVEAVEITPAEVNVGDTVKISATISDDQSGVHGVFATLDSPNFEKYESISLVLNSETNKWEGTYEVKEFDLPGSWHVNVTAFDNAGNYGSNEAEYQVVIHNPNGGDVVSPTVHSLVMSTSTAKPGDTVHFEAKLSDAKSGVKSATIYLYSNSSANSYPITLAYDESNEVWSADYVIPAFASAGFHSLYLDVADHAGNVEFYYPINSLLILNDFSDNEAPKFESISISPEQALRGEEVTFKVNFTDNQSGVKNASLVLFNPDSADSYNADDERAYRFIDLAYSEQENVWIGTYTVKATDPLGSWKISYEVEDLAGNWNMAAISEKFVTYEDVTPPATPVVAEISDQSAAVTGTTEAGASVTVSIGSETYSGTADANGNFTITIPVQSAGTVITVTAKDRFDNASEVSVTVVDKTPPAAPTVETVTDKTTVITGTTEKNSTVTAKIGDTIYTGTTFSNGVYKITIPRQATGTSIIVTAADGAGNVSQEVAVTVGDATAPGIPTVNFVTDSATVVTGVAEAGATVTVTIGTETYTGSADSTGAFSVTIPAQAAGTVLTVKATDAAGNTGNARSVTVIDRTAPATPSVNYISDQATVVTGVVEAGATVVVTIGTENYTGTADANGAFQVTIPQQKAGTRVYVRAIDAAGNKSNLRDLIVVDKTAPSAPTVNEVSDSATLVTGTTEGGATITVTIGTAEYTARAFSNGTFRVSIPAQPVGTRILIRATDAGGNKSTLSSVRVVDRTPPAVPTLDPVTAKSTEVRGTTDGGAYITVTIGSQSYTARAFSNGTFRVAIPAQAAGVKISVSAADALGNKSAARTVTVTQ
jgi:hypothetical protein